MPRPQAERQAGRHTGFLPAGGARLHRTTLVVSWRLEGSAAAINDSGSLRMRTYRLAYLAGRARPGHHDVAA